MTNKEIAKMLREEKWYPAIHLTEIELKTAKLLNDILEDIAHKIETINHEEK